MHGKRSAVCALLTVMLLFPHSLAMEASSLPWGVYRTQTTGEDQVEVLLDYSSYEDIRVCAVSVDEGSFLPELVQGMTLMWDGDERTALISWDAPSEMTFLYRPSPRRQGTTAVSGELVFSCYNADGERIRHDRVQFVRTDSGLRLSIKSAGEEPQPAPLPGGSFPQDESAIKP